MAGDSGKQGYSLASLVVHAGRPPAEPGGAVNPAVWLSSTYRQGGDLTYGRDGNRTWEAFEEALGRLEGGRCLLFGSGMAAIAAVLECLPVPGRVVVAGDAYSGTRRFLSDVAGRGRLLFRTVDVSDTDAVLETCAEVASAPSSAADGNGKASFGTRGLLWLETPTNPMLTIADLDAICTGARELGIHVAVDNTFATPLLQRPLDLGADVVIHSASKAISGHTDVVLGAAVSRSDEIMSLLTRRRSLHGAIAGPFEAWLGLRGLRTLAVRMERAQANAGVIAERLSAHPAVTKVRYPGLAEHPGHDLAARQMSGFGSMISFDVAGADADAAAGAAEAVVAAVELLTPGTSLGGVESLIERRGRWEGEGHLPPGLIRLSVGIEDVEDIWADLDRALSSVRVP